MAKPFMNNAALEAHRIDAPYLRVPFGPYCGILAKPRLAGKMAALQQSFLIEARALLAANLDSLEVAHWTLDYSDGKQRSLDYIVPQSDDDKLARIAMLKNTNLCHPAKAEDLFRFANDNEARATTETEAQERERTNEVAQR
ncbi:MAG: hypothetical protein GY851_35485 [bacterium]|nr:hypothetical protein [bacterium]